MRRLTAKAQPATASTLRITLESKDQLTRRLAVSTLRITLESKDQLRLETNGLGGIGCAWYEYDNGFLRNCQSTPRFPSSSRAAAGPSKSTRSAGKRPCPCPPTPTTTGRPRAASSCSPSPVPTQEIIHPSPLAQWLSPAESNTKETVELNFDNLMAPSKQP